MGETGAMLSVSQLRIFVAVAEELHYGRAAQRLQMTQPPVSRSVQSLEAALNVTLLIRDRRSVQLTPAGAALLTEARDLLSAVERSEERVRQIASGAEGTLGLGFTATAALDVLGTVVAEFQQALPRVALELMEAVTADQLTALQRGRLDLALMRPVALPPGFTARTIHRERLMAAIPSGWARPSVSVEDFAGEPLILWDAQRSAYFHDLTTAALGAVRGSAVQRVSQVHAMLGLVSAQPALALVPESAGKLRIEGVDLVLVEDLPGEIVELKAVWSRGNPNPALRRGLEAVTSLRARPAL